MNASRENRLLLTSALGTNGHGSKQRQSYLACEAIFPTRDAPVIPMTHPKGKALSQLERIGAGHVSFPRNDL